jgi:hypothetical protein
MDQQANTQALHGVLSLDAGPVGGFECVGPAGAFAAAGEALILCEADNSASVFTVFVVVILVSVPWIE